MAKFNLDDSNYDDSPAQLPQNPYAPSPTPRDTYAGSAPQPAYQGTPNTQSKYDAVGGMYQSLLGRGGSANEINNWLSGNNGDINKIQFGIFNSPEAKAYLSRNAQTPGGAASGGGSPSMSAQDFIRQYQGQHPISGSSMDDLTAALAAAGYTNTSRYMYGSTPSGNELNVDGQKYKVRVDGGDWYTGGNDGGGGGYGGPGNPFDDPATKGYIDQLNARIQQLQTPYQNPDMAPLLGYMRKYFEQLQQPVYTDQQRDIINTQTIDPLERQRSARKQQVLQSMANRGMGPSDGPTIQALQDVDREFDQQRTSQRGQFASNEINLGRQNQQQAVDVGSGIASLQNGQFMQQDARANQAVGLGRQVPDMAQDRLQRAIALLNGNTANPASLFAAQNSFQNSGMAQSQQDSAYWQSIMAQISQAFGL